MGLRPLPPPSCWAAACLQEELCCCQTGAPAHPPMHAQRRRWPSWTARCRGPVRWMAPNTCPAWCDRARCVDAWLHWCIGAFAGCGPHQQATAGGPGCARAQRHAASPATWARPPTAPTCCAACPPQVGLNNMKQNDYANVVVQALIRIHPIRCGAGGGCCCLCLAAAPAAAAASAAAALSAVGRTARARQQVKADAPGALPALLPCPPAATSSCGQRTTPAATRCWCSALASW